MTVLQLEAEVTEQGELHLKLPKALPPGRARVTIEIPSEERLTDVEIEELMRVEPLSGAEIVRAGLTGGWSDQGIADAVEWVEQTRRKRRARRSW